MFTNHIFDIFVKTEFSIEQSTMFDMPNQTIYIYIYIYISTSNTSPAFWLGRLAFVSDGVSKSRADSMPKGFQLRLDNLRVGELLF